VTAKELKKIAKQMRSLGITHLKTADYELDMAPEAVVKIPPAPKLEPVEEITEEEHEKIRHTLDNIKKTFLGNDEDLINHLFPVTVEEKESA